MMETVLSHVMLDALIESWKDRLAETVGVEAAVLADVVARLEVARHAGRVTPTTRDLRDVVDACQVVEDELRFQAARLLDVLPRTEKEATHLVKQERGYHLASCNVQMLREYHVARMQRLDETGSTRPVAASPTQEAAL